MDSGNSGSLQSSSGGDEEYDSRAADSVSAFMSGGPISNPAPPFFDPLSTYLQLHQNPNSSLLNSNLSWPRVSAPPMRSDPNPISHEIVHSMLPTSNPFMPAFQPTSSGLGADSGGSPTVAPPLNQNQGAPRNPKKRSRASRRAPTTVLTTDTTNFRAMVQEFTGIPAPPFNSSAFPRSRLDLFGSRCTSLDAAQPPPYLRRPFAQKIQPPHPFLASSSSLLSPAAVAASTTPTSTAAAASSSTPPSMNYQLPITNPSNLFNIPNQSILTSLLQSSPKFPFSTSPIIGSKPFELSSNDHQTKIGGLDDHFGLGHNNQASQTLAGLPNLIPSDQMAARNDHNDNDNADTSNAARWSNNPDGDKHDLRQLNGSYDFQRNPTSGKMSFSASSTSGFHGGKAAENVGGTAVRGEGMVESWICSSE